MIIILIKYIKSLITSYYKIKIYEYLKLKNEANDENGHFRIK